VIARYRDEAAVEGAFDELRADWRAYLGRLTVTTPDPEMTEMLNVWNQVQCRTTLNWSRFVSGYETGLGRGMGTRDSAQDTLGTMHSLPGQARRTLTRTWSLQFRDGHAWHQIFPLSGEGGPGLAAEFSRLAPVVLGRSSLAGPRDVRLPSRDRRSGLPGRARSVGRRGRRHDPGAYAARGRVHARQSRPARPPAGRLRRLGRHAQRRPRVGQGGERLVRDAVLPGRPRPGRPEPPPGPLRRRGAVRRPPPGDGDLRERRRLGTVRGMRARFDDDGRPIGGGERDGASDQT